MAARVVVVMVVGVVMVGLAAALPRGVAPEGTHAAAANGFCPAHRCAAAAEATRYSGPQFQCDGSRTLASSAVNDDYCDCADGTDEPGQAAPLASLPPSSAHPDDKRGASAGTSACSRGRFYCANVGHRPELLVSSRVNDGICDCCDGTDEYNGLENCLNTCQEAGRAAREAEALQSQKLMAGYQKRLQLEAEGKSKQQVSPSPPPAGHANPQHGGTLA